MLLLWIGLACRGAPPKDTDLRDTATESERQTRDSVPDPPEPTTVTIEPGLPGAVNHLLPLRTYVDPAARRAFIIAESLGTLASVDLDTGALLYVQPFLPDMGFGFPVGDGQGGVWIYEQTAGRVARVGADRQVAPLETSYAGVRGLALVAGEVWIAGQVAGGPSMLSRWAPGTLEKLGEVELPDVIGKMIPWSADSVMLLTGAEAVEYGPEGERQRFAVPWPSQDARRFGDQLALVREGGVALASAAGITEVEAGTENTGLVVAGDRLIALDRDSYVRNMGGARSYDAALQEVAPVFMTGKNSGYGGYDPVTARLWVNSEGTTEIQSYDPWTGQPDRAIRLGTHVESAAIAPGAPDQVYITGRLSGLLARFDTTTGERIDAEEPPFWPVAPVVWESPLGTWLWVASQTDSTVCSYGLDLVRRGCFDLGLPPDPTLVIADLAVYPGTGLLYTNGASDILLQLDPDGVVERQWLLSADDPPTDGMAGRLEILPSPDAEGVTYVVRCADGRASRVEGDAVLTVHALDGLIADRTAMQCAAWHDGHLYVGGLALDPLTLERAPDADQAWDYALPDGSTYEQDTRTVLTPGGASILIPPGDWRPQFFQNPDLPKQVGWLELESATATLWSPPAL